MCAVSEDPRRCDDPCGGGKVSRQGDALSRRGWSVDCLGRPPGGQGRPPLVKRDDLVPVARVQRVAARSQSGYASALARELALPALATLLVGVTSTAPEYH